MSSLGVMSLATQIFCLAMALVLFGAIRFGSSVDRKVAVLFTVATVLTLATRRALQGGNYAKFDGMVGALDFFLLASLAAIAIKERRWWLYTVTALQMLTCLGHVAKLIDPSMAPMAYFMMLVASSYPTLMLLSAAIWQSHRERTRRPCSNGSSREAVRSVRRPQR